MLLADLLETNETVLKGYQDELAAFTGKKGVLEALEERLRLEVSKAISDLGLVSPSSAEVISSLEKKIAKTEEGLRKILSNPDCSTNGGCSLTFSRAKEIVRQRRMPPGHFLKEDKARELIKSHPPKKIMETLGYSSVGKMLEKEDIWEIYAALRFVEERSWLNNEFFKTYEGLTPDDFEERDIKLMVLSPKWGGVGEAFMRKKFHNVSHLKELGFIFILPVEQVSGVLVRMFSLLLHYHHEISFYGRYFKYVAENNPKNFSKKLTSALRGDVPTSKPLLEDVISIMIVQRYLYKEDPKDPRLGLPHLAPEAWHWKKAADDLAKLGKENPSLGLDFWSGRSYLGALIDGKVVSFNFEDNAFSLPAAEKSLSAEEGQFTYHFKEALWNRIFLECFGEKGFEDTLIESFAQGFVLFR